MNDRNDNAEFNSLIDLSLSYTWGQVERNILQATLSVLIKMSPDQVLDSLTKEKVMDVKLFTTTNNILSDINYKHVEGRVAYLYDYTWQ